MDIRAETEECISCVMRNIPVWKEQSVNETDSRIDTEKTYGELFDKFVNKSEQWVNNVLLSMEDGLYIKGLFEENGLNSERLLPIYKKCFIKELSTISEDTMTDKNIRECIKRAKNTVKTFAAPESIETVKECITNEINIAEQAFFEYIRRMLPMVERFPSVKERFDEWKRLHGSFPNFSWSMEPVPDNVDLTETDVIQYVDKAIWKSIHTLSGNILEYINSWRVTLLKSNEKIIESCSNYISMNRSKIESLEYRKRTFEKASADMSVLQKILDDMR